PQFVGGLAPWALRRDLEALRRHERIRDAESETSRTEVALIMPPKPMSEARMREIIRDQFATSINEFMANMNSGAGGSGGASGSGEASGSGGTGGNANGTVVRGARPTPGNMNGWVDDDDDVEEDEENEDDDMEEDDDAEIIFPYEVQGDQTPPPKDESSDSDSEPEAEDADDELEVEEAGVEPEAEGADVELEAEGTGGRYWGWFLKTVCYT
nr:hypothetical protein [Tanacetum cinerariifolium]